MGSGELEKGVGIWSSSLGSGITGMEEERVGIGAGGDWGLEETPVG